MVVSASARLYNERMSETSWLPIYGAVLATVALGWNIISHVINTLRNRPGVKLTDLRLTEWTTSNPKIEFRATNHKEEPVRVDCFGFMMRAGQEFPPYAPTPENSVVPKRDHREFAIPLTHIRREYGPAVREEFPFVFVKDATGETIQAENTKRDCPGNRDSRSDLRPVSLDGSEYLKPCGGSRRQLRKYPGTPRLRASD